jgi:hypothetical protein
MKQTLILKNILLYIEILANSKIISKEETVKINN